MAQNTPLWLRNAVIYSIYVRSHTPEGTFRAIEPDLDRIRALGTDIIWFMPIHPIGVQGKKGSLGCPYANRDYRTVNPEYGSMEDFRHLVQEIHRRGMRCMIDVVYNHTAPDSTLVREHPDWFYHRPDGSLGNRMGDWSDVVDLDYRNAALWDYQLESLRQWAQLVDGFRCDVASLVPVAFWQRARQAVAEVNPDCIWLAETVHSSFNLQARRAGLPVSTDSEAYSAFDLEYDYDLRETFDAYLAGTAPLHALLDRYNLQEVTYPVNYIKLRCLENHDQPRIAGRVAGAKALDNWEAFLFFQKGTTLLYAGEEFSQTHLPSLFDKDLIGRDGTDRSPQLAALAALKKRYFPTDGYFHAWADDTNDIAAALYGNQTETLLGVFSLKGRSARVSVPLPDGDYTDLLQGRTYAVQNRTLPCTGDPLWLRVPTAQLLWPETP